MGKTMRCGGRIEFGEATTLKKLIYMLLAVAMTGLLGGCSGTYEGNQDSLPKLEKTQKVVFVDGQMDFHSVYDSVNGVSATNSCLEKPATLILYPGSYNNVKTYTMKMIESKKDLYDSLNASYSTNANYLIGHSSAAYDLSNTFSSELNSIYVLVTSDWQGPVFSLGPNPPLPPDYPDIKFPYSTLDEFKTHYPNNEVFTKNCGDGFISQIQAGMNLYALFKVTYKKMSDKSTVSAKLKNKTFTVKTSAEFTNTMQISATNSTVEVMIRTIGGGGGMPNPSVVKSVDTFFTYITEFEAYQDKILDNIDKKGAVAALTDSKSGSIIAGYAVNASVQSYASILKNQYNLDPDLTKDWYSVPSLGSDWNNFGPISSRFIKDKEAYNTLGFIVDYAAIIVSPSDSNKFLSEVEKQSFQDLKNEFEASYSGLDTLMTLCNEPDKLHTIEANKVYAANATDIDNISTRDYCTTLYGCTGTTTDPKECAQCNTSLICPALYDKLKKSDPQARNPFFTDKVLSLPAVANEAPNDCYTLKNTFPALSSDGVYKVYFGGDANKPYDLFCLNMSTTSPLSYLKLGPPSAPSTPASSGTNFSSNVVTNKDVTKSWTAFEKIRVATSQGGLRIIRDDYTYATFADPNVKTPFGETHSNWIHNDLDSTHQGHANLDFQSTPFALFEVSNDLKKLWTLSGSHSEFTNWYPTDHNDKDRPRPNAAGNAITVQSDNKKVDLWIAGTPGQNVPTNDLILNWVGQ